MMPLLELTDVTRRYGPTDSPSSIQVLDGISLSVQRGDSLAVTGPSGCGKSTLLNLIGALDRPTTGRVCLNGEDLSRLPESRLADIRNRKIGFIFQQHHLLPQCTVLENVLVPTLATSRASSARAAATARAERLLDQVGLTNRRDYRPGQLSGGEAQRVAVVRALINQPGLLLADEPTGALDAATARDLGNLLMSLNQTEDAALIVVTHNQELAGRMATVYGLRNGRLEA